MSDFLNILLLINAIALVVVIMLQPPKSENAAGTMSGTGVNVFAQTKERGAELVFKKATIFLGATFMIIPIIIAVIN
jgi:preprotein translocase subunit SecG